MISVENANTTRQQYSVLQYVGKNTTTRPTKFVRALNGVDDKQRCRASRQ